MNRSDRKRRSSCVDEEVCSNSVRGTGGKLEKKLLTRPASLEIRRYQDLATKFAGKARSRRLSDCTSIKLAFRDWETSARLCFLSGSGVYISMRLNIAVLLLGFVSSEFLLRPSPRSGLKRESRIGERQARGGC